MKHIDIFIDLNLFQLRLKNICVEILKHILTYIISIVKKEILGRYGFLENLFKFIT